MRRGWKRVFFVFVFVKIKWNLFQSLRSSQPLCNFLLSVENRYSCLLWLVGSVLERSNLVSLLWSNLKHWGPVFHPPGASSCVVLVPNGLCYAGVISRAIDVNVKIEGGPVMLSFWRAFTYRLMFKMTGALNLLAFALPVRLTPMHNFSASFT